MLFVVPEFVSIKGNVMNMTNLNDKQIEGVIRIVAIVGEAIRDLCELKPEGYPSEALYTGLMANLTREQYNAVINALKKVSCVVEDQNHLIKWIGPTKEIRDV